MSINVPDFKLPIPARPALSERLGYLRLDAIVGDDGLFPISKSSWWAKVKSGVYPQPVKLGPRTTAWRVRDILDLIERLEKEGLS